VSQPASPPEKPRRRFSRPPEARIYTYKFGSTESPDDGGDNPPKTPNDNGHGGSHSGFSPPEAPAGGIYPNKFRPEESPTRMTKRLPDRKLMLSWESKTEAVAPENLQTLTQKSAK
jgi:hypothetical protein